MALTSPSRGLLLCISLLVSISNQQAENPVTDFCRRWGHQTAVIDRRLYIDGGLLDWNPISQNPYNYTNTWLLYQDLDHTNQGGMPILSANLSKNGTVPSVSGGTLWADHVNKAFYLWGGQFQSQPRQQSFWLYDVILNQWNESTANIQDLEPVAYGAGVTVEPRGEGYYLGGYINNQTEPMYTGPPLVTSNLIKYDMTHGQFTNNTGPDKKGRAEGMMTFLPASDNGLLIYFGGVVDANRTGNLVGSPMSTIHVFDINSEKWYEQEATGQVPDVRRQACIGSTYADDRSSYNIYMYGGISPNGTAFDDVYILTLPSFRWIQWYQSQPGQGRPHYDLTCNVVDRAQMLVIGGTFPYDEDCDSPNVYGTHNLNLGQDGPQKAQWDLFYPNITQYQVPPAITSVVGGGATGGATARAPATGFDNEDLTVYFTRTPSFAARTPTRAVPGATLSHSPSGSRSGHRRQTNVGAVVGGVVGGMTGIVILVSLGLYIWHRSKSKPLQRPNSFRHELPGDTIPVEIVSKPELPAEHEVNERVVAQSPQQTSMASPYHAPIPPFGEGLLSLDGLPHLPASSPTTGEADQHLQRQYTRYDPDADVMRRQHYPPPHTVGAGSDHGDRTPSISPQSPPQSPPTQYIPPTVFDHSSLRPDTLRREHSRSPSHGSKFVEEEDAL